MLSDRYTSSDRKRGKPMIGIVGIERASIPSIITDEAVCQDRKTQNILLRTGCQSLKGESATVRKNSSRRWAGISHGTWQSPSRSNWAFTIVPGRMEQQIEEAGRAATRESLTQAIRQIEGQSASRSQVWKWPALPAGKGGKGFADVGASSQTTGLGPT